MSSEVSVRITHLKRTQFLFVSALALVLVGCGGREVPAAGTTPAASTPAAATPAAPTTTSLALKTTARTLKSDGSDTVTITATTLGAGNAILPSQAVTFSASSGQLGASTGTTDATGVATATFSAGSSGINRTATITVTSGAATMQLPIQISGSTVTANPAAGTNLPDDGTAPATVVFSAKDPAGAAVSGATVTLAKSGVGNISFTPTTGTTDVNGQFSVTVSGVAGGAGAATLTATALGATGSASFTVATAASTFSISGLSLNTVALTSAATNSFSNTAMKIGESLLVTVTTPAAVTNVTFVSTMGSWNGGAAQAPVTVPVAGGAASATLTTAGAGIANVQVIDAISTNQTGDSLSVAMTAATAASISIQAAPSVIQKTVGTSAGASTLIATVNDATGQPVGGAPVFFSILNPTGGGETLSPAVAYTTSTTGNGLNLGQAKVTFTAGSLSSTATGIQINARVLGTTITTEAAGVNATASGNDAAVVIGGTAASMAFGQATVLGVNSNATAYVLPMSITVADGNGNPAPAGTLVSLSLWPIAWSTGVNCAWDADKVAGATPAAGTFLNEDINENLLLDTGEDGKRTYYYGTFAPVTGGLIDNLITPANSMAGTVPATVTTDATGLANFNLTYPISSALWTVVRLRARTIVQGSAAVGETQFRFGGLLSDITPCRLPDSPHRF